MTLKQAYQEYLRERFNFDEPEEIICYVSDMLDMFAGFLARTEPYATKAIRQFEDAAATTYELMEYLDTEVMQ